MATLSGLKRRIAKTRAKSLDPRGFGQNTSNSFLWYSIEWNKEAEIETELIELHWIKVERPCSSRRERFRIAMDHAQVPENLSVEDFLATLYMGKCTEDKRLINLGVNAGFLFRASKKGDCQIRDVVAQVFGTWTDETVPAEDIVNVMAWQYCSLDEVVPGEQVTLANRRLIRR
jgi:hypothetical protein